MANPVSKPVLIPATQRARAASAQATQRLRRAAQVRRRRARFQPKYRWQVRARWRRQRFSHRAPQLSLLPSIIALGSRSVVSGFAARYLPRRLQTPLIHRSQQASEEMLQQMQRLYFNAPWVTYATWAAGVGLGRFAAATMRTVLRLQIIFHLGDAAHARERIARIPQDGFQSLMTGYLMFCEAAGYLRGGAVRVAPRWIDGVGDFPQPLLESPATMAQALTQIDQLYWSGDVGAVFKVIHVGDRPGRFTGPMTRVLGRVRGRVREQLGEKIVDFLGTAGSEADSRQPETARPFGAADVSVAALSERIETWARDKQPRWIVMIPGTAHMTPTSTANPADTQSNLYEVLGYPSAIRYGVLRGLLDAFTRAGIVTEAEQRLQRVMFVGHSQGAMVAAALAADPEVPCTPVAVLSAGGPIGATPIPDSVSVLALRHVQDPVAAMDDPHTRGRRSTVVFERSLDMIDVDTLYFAHEVTTYADTATLASEAAKTSANPAFARVTRQIERFFPQRSRSLRIRESSRPFVYEVTQELLRQPEQLYSYQQAYTELCHHGEHALPLLSDDSPFVTARGDHDSKEGLS